MGLGRQLRGKEYLLLYKYKDLSSNLQQSHRKLGMAAHACNPNIEEQRIPRTYWPASQHSSKKASGLLKTLSQGNRVENITLCGGVGNKVTWRMCGVYTCTCMLTCRARAAHKQIQAPHSHHAHRDTSALVKTTQYRFLRILRRPLRFPPLGHTANSEDGSVSLCHVTQLTSG